METRYVESESESESESKRPQPSEDLIIAETAEHVQPGELILLDEKGRPTGWLRLQLMGLAQTLPLWLAIGVAFGFIAVAANVSAWWFLPLIVLAQRPVDFLMGRTARPLLLAHARLSAGDTAGAEAILATAPRPRRGRMGALRARLEGFLADAEGDVQQAIVHYERSLALFPKGIDGLLTRITLADALARDCRLESAREIRAGIEVSPGADVIDLALAEADLTLAIAAGREAELDEATLHAWVRLALMHNSSKNLLVALARVLVARGDEDLADHCLRESDDRFTWCSLERTWPPLHRWSSERKAQTATLPPREVSDRAAPGAQG
jgi:hypothetical protein